MKKFNWDDFISNKETPVTTYEGLEVEIIGLSKNAKDYPVIIYIRSSNGSWSGPYSRTKSSQDLFFKPNYQLINGIECPLPFEPKNAEKYFFPTFETKLLSFWDIWSNTDKDKLIRDGVGCYRTRKDAIQVVKALLKGIGR